MSHRQTKMTHTVSEQFKGNYMCDKRNRGCKGLYTRTDSVKAYTLLLNILASGTFVMQKMKLITL